MDISWVAERHPLDEPDPVPQAAHQLAVAQECQRLADKIERNEPGKELTLTDDVAFLDACDRRIYASDLRLGDRLGENAAIPISNTGIDLNLERTQQHEEPHTELTELLVYEKTLFEINRKSPRRTPHVSETADFSLDGLPHSHPKRIFSVAPCRITMAPTNEDTNEVDLQLSLASPAIHDLKCRDSVLAPAPQIVNLDMQTGDSKSGTSRMLDGTGFTWKKSKEASATKRRAHGWFVNVHDQTCGELDNESMEHPRRTDVVPYLVCSPETVMRTADLSTKELLWPDMYQHTRSEQRRMLGDAQCQSNFLLKRNRNFGIACEEQHESNSTSLEEKAKSGRYHIAGQLESSSHGQEIASLRSKRQHKISERNVPKLGELEKECEDRTTNGVRKSHIWIQRWHPNTKGMLHQCALSTKRNSTTYLTFDLNKNKDNDSYGLFCNLSEAKNSANLEYQGLENFKVNLTKTLPSVTAMAIVGTATKRFCSFQHRRRGSRAF